MNFDLFCIKIALHLLIKDLTKLFLPPSPPSKNKNLYYTLTDFRGGGRKIVTIDISKLVLS